MRKCPNFRSNETNESKINYIRSFFLYSDLRKLGRSYISWFFSVQSLDEGMEMKGCGEIIFNTLTV